MLSRFRPLTTSSRSLRLARAMATSAPEFRPFKLALIQLGQVTEDKATNLKHAREMIRKAVAGEGTGAQGKPDIVVLPVRVLRCSCATANRGPRAGMLQLSIRHSIVSRARRGDRIQARGEVRRGGLQKRQCEDAVHRCQGGGYLVDRRCVHGHSCLRCIWTANAHSSSPGSIPERDASDSNLYNTATVYSPQGPLSVFNFWLRDPNWK
jgi:hypothetical protein